MDKIGILILAAGFSRRYPGDKRRARIGDATLLQLTVDRYLQARLPLRLCLRDNAADRSWAAAFPAPVQLLFCDRSPAGMGATLAQGIAACDDWRATLVGLGDMPAVAAPTLRQLAEHAAEDRIVAPRYRGRRGNPVVFGRRYYPQLARLADDRGARDLLQGAQSRLRIIEVDDPGVLLDVDTPQALARVVDR